MQVLLLGLLLYTSPTLLGGKGPLSWKGLQVLWTVVEGLCQGWWTELIEVTRHSKVSFLWLMGFPCQVAGDLVRYGCHNKVPQTGVLKQQAFIFSLFWKLEV